MERNVSCLNSRAIIEYVRRHYPDKLDDLLENLDPFFETVENIEEYLLDEHNWISQHVCIKMFQRVKDYSGNPEVAREIGHKSVMNRRFGYVENIFIKAIGHPYLSILRAPAINAKFNKTKTVEIVDSDWSHATIRLRWFKDIGSTKDVCLYNQGIYEAIPTIWGLPLARTTEHKCYFEGDEYCEYEFVWTKKSFLAILFGMFTRHRELLNETLAELEREKMLMENKYREVEQLNIELRKKIEQLTSLDACSKATTSILDTDRLLDVVVSLIVNIMQFDRALIMLVDDDTNRLVPVKTAGGEEGAIVQIKNYSIPLNRTNNILARVVSSGIAQIVRDVDHSFLRRENIILKKFRPKSFVAVPLITRNKVIGVMAAERIKGLDDFSSNDLDYVMNFCNQIAISLENARLIEHMKQSFVSSILSLASALEAKDPYTRGHSNRVATYSTIIARRMGLDEEHIELVRLMALMHDIGKIGIPDKIINKPGRLDIEEFNVIKRHPLVSLSIIEPLLANKPELRDIKSHHERYDGLGYPEGLVGKNIPLEARIMSVADSFDAMTTNRPYRAAMSREEALAEVIRGKGSQFCPDVVDVFIEIIMTMPPDLYRLINTSSEMTVPVA